MKKKTYEDMEREVEILVTNNPKMVKKYLYSGKKRLSNLESVKEAFIVVYIPAQILLWSLDAEKLFPGFKVFTIILFSVLFIALLDRINNSIFWQKTEIEIVEKRLKS